jgi:F-type H+-transporting ATPase subunit b
MMKKLILAAVLAAPAIAFAQHGSSDLGEHPPVEASTDSGNANETPAGTAHDVPHGAADPTKHYNWTGAPFEHNGKDVYGGKLGDGEMIDPHTGQAVIDPHTGKPAEEEPMSPAFIWMLVNFGILMIILAKFGGPAARKLAQERHDQISTALDEAKKLREQAAQKLAEYESRIKDVDSEVKKLVDGIRADAESDKKRILEAAEAQAKQMKRDAEIRIAAEIEYARKSLQREVTTAAANATEKLLKDKLTRDDQTKLVSTFISNVDTGVRGKEAR